MTDTNERYENKPWHMKNMDKERLINYVMSAAGK